MFRTLTALTAVISLGLCPGLAACGAAGSSPIRAPGERPPSPSILAEPPPQVRLRSPAAAILSDQLVGLPRQTGIDHLTAAEAASEQNDQAAALAEFTAWGWLDGASRSWSQADEVLVMTARNSGAVRAFKYWAGDAGKTPFAAGACSAAADSGLDDCALGVAADRAIVVGRLGSAVFRISCPTGMAERLTMAQVAFLAVGVP